LVSAEVFSDSSSEPVAVLTRDERQAQAAVALGFTRYRPDEGARNPDG
jgi:hypothetical protein